MAGDVRNSIKMYLLDGLGADGKLLFRTRAARASTRLVNDGLFDAVPYSLAGKRSDLGGLYVVVSRRWRGPARQSAAWGLLRELRTLARADSPHAALEALSARVGKEAGVYRDRANLWSLMLIQWVVGLAADDDYLQGRMTLGQRLLHDLVPDIDEGTTVDRWQGGSILVRMFGDLRDVEPVVNSGMGVTFPLVNLVGDEELLDDLVLRAADRQAGMEGARDFLEGEARVFVMVMTMLPMASGVLIVDVALEATIQLCQFLLAAHEAGLADAPDEWDVGVVFGCAHVFIPMLRNVPFLGLGVRAFEFVELVGVFAYALLAVLVNALELMINALARSTAAGEAGFSSYAELDTEEMFEFPFADFEVPGT